jgi:hypothetical protein
LLEATACFQGVRRPYGKEGDGRSVLIYVVRDAVLTEEGDALIEDEKHGLFGCPQIGS